jgi:hypothetical protein
MNVAPFDDSIVFECVQDAHSPAPRSVFVAVIVFDRSNLPGRQLAPSWALL